MTNELIELQQTERSLKEAIEQLEQQDQAYTYFYTYLIKRKRVISKAVRKLTNIGRRYNKKYQQ